MHLDTAPQLGRHHLIRSHPFGPPMLLYCCSNAKGLTRLTVQRAIANQAEASRPVAKIGKENRGFGGRTEESCTTTRGRCDISRAVEEAWTAPEKRGWPSAPRAHVASDQSECAGRHARLVAEPIRTIVRVLRHEGLAAGDHARSRRAASRTDSVRPTRQSRPRLSRL
jgi:hypothetical protein